MLNHTLEPTLGRGAGFDSWPICGMIQRTEKDENKVTIYNRQNSKFLTDAQWLTLMRLVDEPTRELDSMLLTMPMGENCPADLTWKGEHYVVHPDGRADILE